MSAEEARSLRPGRAGPHPGWVIGAMGAAEILSMSGHAAFQAMAPGLAGDWALTASDIGWIGGSYFAGSALGTAILPAATDRVDARLVYLGSLAVAAAGLVGFALMVDGTAAAATMRFVQGLGLAGTYFPGLRALLAAVPPGWQSRATALYAALYNVGTSLSFFASGVLAPLCGARATFALLAVGPVLAALLAAAALRGAASPARRGGEPVFRFGPVLERPVLLRHIAAYAALCGQILVLQTWLVTLLCLGPRGGIDPTLAATLAAAIVLAAVPASILGDRMAERRGRRGVIVTVMGASLVLFVATFAAAAAPLPALAGLALALFATTTLNSASITNGLREVCPPALLGRALSLYALAGALASMAAPFLFGVVIDRAGGPGSAAAWAWSGALLALCFAAGPLALAGGAAPRRMS